MVKARLSRGVGNPGPGFEEGLYYIPSSPFLFDPSLSLCVYLPPCGFPSLSFPPSLSPSLSRSGGSSSSSKSVNMSVLHHYDITLALLVKQCVCLLCRWCAAEIQDVRLPRQNDACRSTARGSSGFEFRDLALGFRVRGFGFSAQSLGFGELARTYLHPSMQLVSFSSQTIAFGLGYFDDNTAYQNGGSRNGYVAEPN